MNSTTRTVTAFVISAVTVLALSLGLHLLGLAGSVATTMLVMLLGQKMLRMVRSAIYCVGKYFPTQHT